MRWFNKVALASLLTLAPAAAQNIGQPIGAISTSNLSDAVTDTPWTPTDASGASLVFTSVTARYTKIGKMVTASFRLTYPSTASNNTAAVGGLPVAMSSNFTAASNIGVGSCFSGLSSNALFSLQMQAGATSVTFVNNIAQGALDSALSTIIVSCTLTYISQ